MKALIFDTETTGMVERDEPPDHPGQPDLIQLGMLLVDTEGWNERASHSMLVQLREGASIDPGAQEAHGISEQECARYGVPAVVACSLFNQLCIQADVIVAHNMKFDQMVMRAALHRLGGKPDRMSDRRLICTMETSRDVLKIPGRFSDYKFPTLAEAYLFFSGEELKGAHDALVDARAGQQIFRAMVDRGVIRLEDLSAPRG